MRILLLTIGLLAFGSTAQAQSRAEVKTVARVRVPDFLILKPGDVTERTLENGKQVRRVTLYVTANRAWTLSVARTCKSECTDGEYTVSLSNGKAVNAQAIVVEYVWDSDEPAPASDEFQYVLVGT